ncbi:MAG: hypothetical protein AB1696_10105 [Planctomycetota bacterium]
MSRYGLRILAMPFLISICLSAPRLHAQEAQPDKPRPPYRVLYSNDSTNVESCVSPFHKRGETFRPEMLEASVDEAAGADVQMLQPGTCWVPWWKGRQYPADEHYRWFKEKTGLGIDGIGQYLADGGDFLGVFVNRCREKKITPFASLRLNDYHGNEHNDILNDILRTGKIPPGYSKRGDTHRCGQSRFELEHPEYRIGPEPEDYLKCDDRVAYVKDRANWGKLRVARVFNWAIPEVPAYQLGFVTEVCEGYDIDGLELDFMRHCRFFRLDETPPAERVRIMTDFVTKVRAILDRTAKPGQRRWLCIRVPLRLASHEEIGIDLAKLVAAGVDMIDLSCYYITRQQSDLPEVCRRFPNTAVYLELTYTNRTGDDRHDRKMSDEQFYTAAHLAYARGAAGVSFFNFAYYRQLGSVVCEPPFHVLKRVGDPAWVAQQPQHYFLTPGSSGPRAPNPSFPWETQSRGRPMEMLMDMAPPTGGWTADGRLRIQTREPMGDAELHVSFNDTKLQPTADISEPYPNPYPDGLGTAETLRAWVAPRDLLKDGINRIRVELVKGKGVRLCFVDLAVR